MKTLTPNIECIGTTRAILGESAFWSTEDNALLWVDIVGRKVLRTRLDSGRTEEWSFDEQTGFVQPCDDGTWLVGQENSILRLDPETGSSEAFLPLEADNPETRTNDAGCDPMGRLLVGTMRIPQFGIEPVGSLYRITGKAPAQVVDTGLAIPNGLAFDPDRNLIYWADTPQRQVWRADYDAATGQMGEKQLFVHLADGLGRPDGAAVDAEGCYWVAAARGWRLLRYSPQGELDLEVLLPVERPSKLAFGGPDLRTIFITTISEDIGENGLGEQSLAGRLLTIDLGIAGLAPWKFRMES